MVFVIMWKLLQAEAQRYLHTMQQVRRAAENGNDLPTAGLLGKLVKLASHHEKAHLLRARQVRWAAENGIDLTTADTPGELAKLARWHPTTAVLLRIRADDPSARCCLARRTAPPKT